MQTQTAKAIEMVWKNDWYSPNLSYLLTLKLFQTWKCGSQRLLLTVWFPTFFKILYFVLKRRKELSLEQLEGLIINYDRILILGGAFIKWLVHQIIFLLFNLSRT